MKTSSHLRTAAHPRRPLRRRLQGRSRHRAGRDRAARAGPAHRHRAGSDIDDVIFGQCYPNGEAPAIGRIAALDAGLACTCRACRSTAAAARACRRCIDAAMRVQTGAAELVIAGGAESMSQAEHYVLGARFGMQGRLAAAAGTASRAAASPPAASTTRSPGGMLETAENLRREYKISRAAQDELALRSHAARRRGAARRPVRRRDRAGPGEGPQGRAERRPSTSIRAPTRRWRSLAGAAADAGSKRTRSRRSPPATPAARTTARPPAS